MVGGLTALPSPSPSPSLTLALTSQCSLLEVVRLEVEGDLWDQSFAQKMRFAEERRARGNRLFKRRCTTPRVRLMPRSRDSVA